MGRKRERVVAPYSNEFGTINPGEECLVVTVSTKTTNLRKGKYLGYLEQEVYQWNRGESKKVKEQKVQVEVEGKKWVYMNEAGETASWTDIYYNMSDEEKKKYKGQYIPCTYITTLQLNRIAPLKGGIDAAIQLV
jgi:hypothetical protein